MELGGYRGGRYYKHGAPLELGRPEAFHRKQRGTRLFCPSACGFNKNNLTHWTAFVQPPVREWADEKSNCNWSIGVEEWWGIAE